MSSSPKDLADPAFAAGDADLALIMRAFAMHDPGPLVEAIGADPELAQFMEPPGGIEVDEIAAAIDERLDELLRESRVPGAEG